MLRSYTVTETGLRYKTTTHSAPSGREMPVAEFQQRYNDRWWCRCRHIQAPALSDPLNDRSNNKAIRNHLPGSRAIILLQAIQRSWNLYINSETKKTIGLCRVASHTVHCY